MHDLVIRNATLVDGTGTPPRQASLAVDGAVISEVGSKLGSGYREINASGLLLTPGWVDIHTHYDGQATWDPQLTPSSWHGVTTAVFGNCGIGFAPVRPGSESFLMQLMEGVEDIPESVLAEGIDFRWESFEQYLDVLEQMPRMIDIGAQVPHGALRFYVMGERGADHSELPLTSEMARMGELLEKALHAGALGFTTSRTKKHRTRDGRFTPSLSAAELEWSSIARAMGRAGMGVIAANSDFAEGEFELLRKAACISNRPLTVLLMQEHRAPELWRDILARIHSARAQGLKVTGQVASRPICLNFALEGSIHPFITHPLWKELQNLSHAQRVARLRADVELRHRLWAQRPNDETTKWIAERLCRSFRLSEPLDYEPEMSSSVAAVADAGGRDPFEVALEWLLEEDGKAMLLHTFENYFDGNLEVVRTLMEDSATVMGIADAGAHVGFMCDAGSATGALTHWARDRRRGPRLPLELLVRKQTRDTAAIYGLYDRGILAPGYKADFNLIDFDRLRLLKPELVYDLPAGGRRMLQRAEGYRHTFVSGVEVLSDDEPTGFLPGRLVRGARPRP